MNAHRQDMVNVELTVVEVADAIERAILEKYKFLTESDGWELQDCHFHEKNLNGAHNDTAGFVGATYFFVKEIEVDDAPAKGDCGGGCGNCLKPCR